MLLPFLFCKQLDDDYVPIHQLPVNKIETTGNHNYSVLSDN